MQIDELSDGENMKFNPDEPLEVSIWATLDAQIEINVPLRGVE